MGSKKQKSKPQDERSVAAAIRRVGEEQIREVASGAVEAEQLVREMLGDGAGDLLRALPPEERKPAADELLERINDGRTQADRVSFWLSMRVRRSRQRLERGANAAATVKAERSRGAQTVNGAKRDNWKAWKDALCKYARVRDPNDVPPHVKKRWVDAIRFRSGEKMPKPPLYNEVPPYLPAMRWGKKPLSVETIKLNLFGHRGG